MQQFIREQWKTRGLWAWLLSPLGLLVCVLAAIKRRAYQRDWFQQTKLEAPIIVVGNITVGGSGKTPMVAYLTQLLTEQGFTPGIISRGYKGEATSWPQIVTPSSDPKNVGDEPVMLAQITQTPLITGAKRAISAQRLIDDFNVDVIVSDDGFQHLQLARDIDVVVTDSTHGFGNGWCLPAGPLRESTHALKYADFQVSQGTRPQSNPDNNECYTMTLQTGTIYDLEGQAELDVKALKQQPLHAIAGIGDPSRFFSTLRHLGYKIIEHAFADHHDYSAKELNFNDGYDLITTEKDAVKMNALSIAKTVWVLPVRAELNQAFDKALLTKLNQRTNA